MNFDQIGVQHVSRRRRPSPLRNAPRSPSSYDASFSQKVWPRPVRKYNAPRVKTSKRRKGSGFSIPVSWVKNLAIGSGLLVIGIVGPNWENISAWLKSNEVSPVSLQDTDAPLSFREARFEPIMPLITIEHEPAFEESALDLTEQFSWTEYTVRPGDSISGIAARYSLTMDTLIAFNDLKEAWNLRTGRTLRIPNMNGIPYTVQANDNLSTISAKMLTPINVILDANDLQSETIQAGDVLFIPGARMDANEFRQAIRRTPPSPNISSRPMILPITSRVTSGYGYRYDPVNPRSGVRRFHWGLDLAGNTGDPVKAAMRGTVINIDHNPNLGNFIILGHGEYQTLYAHLSAYSVRLGDNVDQGQEIGQVGSTGYTTGPHLHFEVFRRGVRINPLDVLR